MTIYKGFAGTYTRETSEGIYQFELNTEKAVLQKVKVAAKVGSPTYLTISETENRLYSVAQDGDQGGVSSYNIEDEGLKLINRQMLAGAPPCHLSYDENVLLSANYHKGSFGAFSVDHQGQIAQGEFITYQDSGPHPRQEKSHAHFAGFSPCKKFAFLCDLGGDKVHTLKFQDGKFKQVARLEVEAGSGPRHIVFHPTADMAYLISELSSEVAVLNYDKAQGTFEVVQYIKAIPENFTETNDASAIEISADGRFLYSGNRGHNSIAVFAIDQVTYQLSLVEQVSSGGDWPRDFTLDPSGAYLVASNQHSGNLVLFKRDEDTGRLTACGSEIKVPEVVCVKFIK